MAELTARAAEAVKERTRGSARVTWRGRRRNKDLAKHVILLVLVVLTFYPFVAMLFMSLKDNPQFIHARWVPTTPFHFENFQYAWTGIHRFIFNSLFVSLTTALGVVTLSALSAYVFARFEFPGKNLLYVGIIALMMVPGILTLVPSFILVRDLKLLDSYWVMILPWIAGGQPFGILLLRTFFEGLPDESFESARLDGASEVQILRSIALPLSAPVFGVLAIMSIISTWNAVIWPSVTVSSDNFKRLCSACGAFRACTTQVGVP